MRKITFLIVAALMSVNLVYSQQEKKSSVGIENIPSIGIHIGTLSYLGDIKGAKGSNLFTYWKPAYGIYLEKKFGNIFGVSANGMFGKIAKSQLDNNVFLNFQTDIINADVNLLLDFDNDKIIHKSSLFTPFFSVGFGFLSFTPKGDLSNNGVLYHHWSDGTLRNLDQATPGADTAAIIMVRDYKYETNLKDTLKNYSKTTFTVPIRMGFKFKLSNNIDARLTAAYILTFTDYLDNFAQGGNDKMFYASFGIQYNFATPQTQDDKYKDFDFKNVDDIDSDGDGVLDSKDMCQKTPKGVKVDSRGCPLDGDKDGVPDYLDKELNTKEGATVNAEGVTITDAMIEQANKMKDSVEVENRVFKADDLSQKEIDDIQKAYEQANNTKLKQNNIPDKFKALDKDGDAFISAKEVTNAIDQFFEGENNLTAKDLHDLIDFYFDQ